LPHLLVSKDSPLTLRPRWSLDQWRWGLRFLAACNADASRRATAALLELAAESRAAFDELRQQESLDCDFSAHGKLVLYGSAQGFASNSGRSVPTSAWLSSQPLLAVAPA
jgi:D-amino-acid dehydrogenase